MDKRVIVTKLINLLDYLDGKEEKVQEIFGEGAEFIASSFDLVDGILKDVLEVDNADFWNEVAAEWIYSLYLTKEVSKEKLLEFLLNIEQYERGYDEMNRALLEDE